MASSTDTELPRMLERARPLDYVTLEGLSVQTGCDPSDLDLFVLKELVDNSLDACEGTNPAVEVIFNTQGQFMTLTVRDNGRGLTEGDVRKVVDFEKLYSTKFHYRYPTRGALGNALKCVFGIPYALASTLNLKLPTAPIKICSKGKEYDIHLIIQELDERVNSQLSSKDSKLKDGTEVSLILPLFEKNWGNRLAYLNFIRGYALFNPDANIKLTVMHPELSELFTISHPSISKRSKRFTGASSIHWYSPAQFKQLIEAYIRSIKRGERDLTLRELIKQFRGLTSDEKVALILREIQAEKEGIQFLSNLAGQDAVIHQLYKAMKRHSYEPSSDVLGEIGRKQIYNRIEQVYGRILRFKYKKFKGVYRGESFSTPYVLEVAIAIAENVQRLEVHTGINHSPCLGNPFEGYHVTWIDRKGREQEATLISGLLEKYKIDHQQPVVLIIHLICPSIEYESYGKGRINIKPFFANLSQIITDVCRFYPRFRRRIFLPEGKESLARYYLREELVRRINLLMKYGAIPDSDKTTQQGIYYKIRNQMGGKIDMARSSFISAIREECERLGRTREELGIFAAARAELYFRGGVYPVSFENISGLAEKGSDIILVEKEGICEVLAPYADKRGVALVNSRGFVVEYAKQLLNLSKVLQANLFTLTDYDASGLVIAQKLPTIPRLGVDLGMISELGLNRRDLEEEYEAPKRHLKSLPLELQEEVRKRRIEIDAILTAVGPEKLWNCLENRILRLAPQRDLTRSIDLTIKIPPEISNPIKMITEFVESIGTSKREEIKQKLRAWSGFADVEEKEIEIQSEIIKEIRKDERVQELAEQLSKLADMYPKR